jgi:hypothetical protein
VISGGQKFDFLLKLSQNILNFVLEDVLFLPFHDFVKSAERCP